MRFRAFVSYSHADAAIAQKLHRKIETYRIPRHLRDRESEEANKGRLGRIFRDREDLPAAEDLSESVKQALAGSEALIIICSPDAKASKWVAREIELFRTLHPGRPVLAALVRGEPEEAFPAPLLDGAEPLAADLRKEGDGWRLGFLKIVAGIAGVPLDALVQRDAARRIRRVMAVTGGALVALLAMIGMTIFAIQSRNEALYQQAEAEGLVEYMLTDLRTALRGVGRLDVMTGVNERAMDYYEKHGDLSDMQAESLERRARILHAMGEDDENRGDLDKARAKFTEAHRVTAVLLERDPDNLDRIFGHAQSEYWLGYIGYLKADWGQAEKYWQGYKRQADKLVAQSSENAKWLREAGYAEGNLCTLALHRNDRPDDATETCRAALEKMLLVSELTGNGQAIMADVANRHGWLADALLASNQFENGISHRHDQEALLASLSLADPDNLDLSDKWLRAQMSLARDLCALQETSKAGEFALAARDKSDSLTAKDPANKKWASWRKQIDDILHQVEKDQCK